jgi:calcineurin-like phosphoesterase family protein
MSKQVFLTSDLHFGHSKMYEMPFRRANGEPLRPWASATEADEALVERWNEAVRPTDKVYVLGDVAIPRSGLRRLEQLNGDKVLVLGNHDSCWEQELRKYFRSVRAYWKLDDFVLSHVPIHPGSLRKFHGNIHGHLHYQVVELPDGTPDPRYLNVCVENTGYSPIAFEEVQRRFAAQQV